MSAAGPIASGSWFAILQSAGAAGLGLAGNSLAAGTGAVAGAALANKMEKKSEAGAGGHNNNGDGDDGDEIFESQDLNQFSLSFRCYHRDPFLMYSILF